ncbi:MAG: tetratricopeptide repeat protein [Deltaproteobacteria bacterium]|nr:tetratricopeptide repeat protein [Deltaproteobacteria bacterium]
MTMMRNRFLQRYLVCGFFVLMLGWSAGFAARPAAASEFDDARVAFGAFDDGLYDFARQELERFVKNYPHSEMREKAYLLLVLCALEGHDCRAAAGYLAEFDQDEVIAGLGVDPAALRLHLAYCFMKAGKSDQARGILLRVTAMKKFPEAVARARYELARIYFARNDFKSAEAMAAPLLAKDRRHKNRALGIDDATLVWIAAFSRFHLKKYRAALPLIKEILAGRDRFALKGDDLQALYGIAIESAWQVRDVETIKKFLHGWMQSAGKNLDLKKFSSALALVTDLFRAQGRLPELEDSLKRAVAGQLPQAEKVSHYEALIEIARLKNDETAFKKYLEAVVPLEKKTSKRRISHLRALLRISFKHKDYPAVARYGAMLSDEDGDFWFEEKYYFPFLSSLKELGRCNELVRYVPGRLPPWQSNLPAGELKRRCYLEIAAGDCLMRLQRYYEAETLYRSVYGHCSDPELRLMQLATLSRVATKIKDGKNLEKWISSEVIKNFPLDRDGNEKLLGRYPELVLLVAEYFFRNREYSQAMPSLFWLEKLKPAVAFRDRVNFLLAESCYRSGEINDALSRYQALYRSAKEPELRYLAALRLAAYYEKQPRLNPAGRKTLLRLYRDLLKWEKSPRLRQEFKNKLKLLEAAAKPSPALQKKKKELNGKPRKQLR